MNLRECRKVQGFYRESIYKTMSAGAVMKRQACIKNENSKKKSTKKNTSKKASFQSKGSKQSKIIFSPKKKKPKTKAKPKQTQSNYDSAFGNFKNDFQFEIIKKLQSSGQSIKRGAFPITDETANLLRKNYNLNCRFSAENSEK
jgi:hypothetical protein